MRRKNELAVDKILECAKAEFMEKGFEGASMRTIAERAGYTTGMLYARFADKSQLFKELVGEAADRLFNYFSSTEDEFAQKSPQEQHTQMHSYVDDKVDIMIDMIYDDFDAFKLIVCKSAGSGYEYYIDKMIDVETANTVRFIDTLNNAGIKINEVRADLSHMLSSAMFYGLFEVVAHDLPKEEAKGYVKQVQDFFNAGWDRLLGLPSDWKSYNI
ncbi:MAG: TetR/AcrR family transcriptional regulator [Clostridia bacterium]|nr:TetR/AcrR family transcriptional regulator [Clostridia bacterium]